MMHVNRVVFFLLSLPQHFCHFYIFNFTGEGKSSAQISTTSPAACDSRQCLTMKVLFFSPLMPRAVLSIFMPYRIAILSKLNYWLLQQSCWWQHLDLGTRCTFSKTLVIKQLPVFSNMLRSLLLLLPVLAVHFLTSGLEVALVAGVPKPGCILHISSV